MDWNAMQCKPQKPEPRWENRRSPLSTTPRGRLWWLAPTVSFWWYAIFILHRMEGHNLHYADKSIIHERHSSQNSETRLFDLRVATVHSVVLPSSTSPLRGLFSGTEWALGSVSFLSRAWAKHWWCLLHQGSIVSHTYTHSYTHTHRRCGLVMISRDYGWLMVGKYIRNHRLREGEGISLTLADLHWSTANEWGLAASSYLPTDK